MKAYHVFFLILLNTLLITSSFATESFSCPPSSQAYSLNTAEQVYDISIRPSFKMDYKNARNGCYERAQKINDLLEHNDLLGFQAFIQAEDPEGCGATGASCISSGYPSHSDNVKIQFQSIYSPGTTYRWNYHTTATLCVNRNGVSELYAIDPSTFRQAVPLKEWVRVLSKNLDRSEYSTLVREFR